MNKKAAVKQHSLRGATRLPSKLSRSSFNSREIPGLPTVNSGPPYLVHKKRWRRPKETLEVFNVMYG
jgi:hypothetical protein